MFDASLMRSQRPAWARRSDYEILVDEAIKCTGPGKESYRESLFLSLDFSDPRTVLFVQLVEYFVELRRHTNPNKRGREEITTSNQRSRHA